MNQARDTTSGWLKSPCLVQCFLNLCHGPVIFIFIRSDGEEAVGKHSVQSIKLVTEVLWRRLMLGQV